MTELRQAREVDLVPDELRFQPQVKSDIIIQRRNVSLAPVEAADTYTRNGTNTITFNIQGHRDLNQLLDTKSLYFQMQCKFDGGYPVEDCSMLFEEVIISSNGRVIERIRHAQYIQHFLRGYGMSRKAKARLGKREGFQRVEDRTMQFYKKEQAVGAANGGFSGSYGSKVAPTTATAPYEAYAAPAAGAQNSDNLRTGSTGYNDLCSSNANEWQKYSRMSDNLGYDKYQVSRKDSTVADAVVDGGGNVGNGGGWGKDALVVDKTANSNEPQYRLMKFRLACSGLLSCDKMLPIMSMPLTIQLRLTDPVRATDNSLNPFSYEIRRPRLYMNVCSVGQSYASAMQSRLRGPGITINAKLFDTYFQIINSDKQLVISSNKQRLSKVYVMFHAGNANTTATENAFTSSVTGDHCHKGITADNAEFALSSYQFQIGAEVSEAITLEDSTQGLRPFSGNSTQCAVANPNMGMAYLEAYLRSIGAVNGHEQDVEFWGRDLDPRCNKWCGGDLLETFLSRYFVCVYDGEKLLGSQIETGVDTESGKDIIVDLRWKKPPSENDGGKKVRAMVLVQYHAQMIIKENSVDLSY